MTNRSEWNKNYNQGFYIPVNVNKYIGDPTNIKYRSSWEHAFCKYLDLNEKVIKWSCEQPIITYQDLSNKTHRYYPDFYYEMLRNGDPQNLERVIVEIKPSNELNPPDKPKKETGKALENYEYAVRTHIKNKLKWNAGVEYAEKRNMKFIIITEDTLIKYGLIPPKNSSKNNKYKKQI